MENILECDKINNIQNLSTCYAWLATEIYLIEESIKSGYVKCEGHFTDH